MAKEKVKKKGEVAKETPSKAKAVAKAAKEPKDVKPPKEKSDVKSWGVDPYKLISKTSSAKEGWMNCTCAMETSNGVVVKETSQLGDALTEAITFVPGAKIVEKMDNKGVVIRRTIR